MRVAEIQTFTALGQRVTTTENRWSDWNSWHVIATRKADGQVVGAVRLFVLRTLLESDRSERSRSQAGLNLRTPPTLTCTRKPLPNCLRTLNTKRHSSMSAHYLSPRLGGVAGWVLFSALAPTLCFESTIAVSVFQWPRHAIARPICSRDLADTGSRLMALPCRHSPAHATGNFWRC